MNIGAYFRSLLKGSSPLASACTLLACGSMLLTTQQVAHASATILADQPIFTSVSVPGNLLLSLSVEFPTAISVANSGAYVNTTSYIGIFDPAKCYLYNFNAQTYSLTAVNDPYNYFYPTKLAGTGNNCAGTAADPEWSGNYLNWVGMQTIDPFRTALTGGYRSLDADNAGGANQVIQTGISTVGVNGAVTLAAGLTVLEKAWGSSQGSASSNFPDRFAAKSTVAGVTPLSSITASWATIGTRIWNGGNLMYFTVSSNSNSSIQSEIDGGTPTNSTPYNPAAIAAMAQDTVYTFKVRVQVCAGGSANTGGLNESNCQPYTTWAKPEGLMQQYNQKIRYGAFGYLNEAGTPLDGGVLRARMNFVGPTRPVVNANPVDNTPVNYGGTAGGTAEWNGTTGVYYQEPDVTDEYNTNWYFTSKGTAPCPTQTFTTGLGGMTAFNAGGTGACAYNSGTLNYLNKFGESSHSYKTDDPVSELYYATMRYFRWFNTNSLLSTSTLLQAVPEYELRSTNTSTNYTWVDGFPVIGACGLTTDANYSTCPNMWSRGLYITPTATTPGTSITQNGYTCGSSPLVTAGMSDPCLKVDPDDPVQYACQKNFILGIGDIHTHADGDLPGGAPYASEEPSVQPAFVANDVTMNFTVPATASTTYTAPNVSTVINIQSGTDMVAALENLETAATVPTAMPAGTSAGDNDSAAPYHGATLTCEGTPNFNAGALGCSGSSHFKYLVAGGDQSTYYMAGEAYDAHTRDIRPHEFMDIGGGSKSGGIQTVSSYWLDVLESQDYKWRNQFWLTAKYGGFSLPTSGWNTYGSTTPNISTGLTQGPLSKTSWNANGNTDLGFPGINSSNSHVLPDHYYNASQANLMVAGLTSAFQSISNALSAFTTSFALAAPTVTASNNVAYATDYNAQYWSGDVTGTLIQTFDANGNPVFGASWDAAALLTARAAASRSVVTCCSAVPGSPGVEFSATQMGANLSSQYGQLASPTLGATSAQMLAWLRGDHTQEVVNGGTLRTRNGGFVLGDIVDSAVIGVGPPSTYYSDATNPGYSTFANNCALRSQMAYVGANDGMMHAFNGSVGQSLSGQEIFAYVPKPTYNGPTNPQTDGLQSLANPSFVHHFFVDSTPTITDVYLPGTTSSCVGHTNTGWQSLLIEGMGKGGRDYFAIDVTDPDAMSSQSVAASKVKWEFTDPTMGFTFGEPVVVKTKKYGWTVIVTSGYNTPDGNGYFYFINPATGVLFEPPIQVGTNPYSGGTYAGFSPSTTNPVGMGPATAFVNDYTDYTADAVYAGDLQGHVWRIDLTGTVAAVPYAPPVMFAQLTSTNGDPQPVTVRVLTEIQPSSNARRILVGTGELLSTADITNTDVQSIYSMVDGTSTPGQFFTNTNPLPGGLSFPVVRANLAVDNLLTGLTTGPTGQLATNPEGFLIDLIIPGGASYRVNVPMAEDGGELAVVANAPNGDACDPSGTHLDFLFDIGTGQSDIVDPNNSGTTLPYFTPATGSGTGTGASFVQNGVGGQGGTQVYFGDQHSATPENPTIKKPQGSGLTRVNWREIPSPE